ncbi:MAG TPA: hypothetical protein VKF81_03905, partial [Blastocatellia bacterium]|nr:hypothetical protein [Blastocatellia bacterium]
MDRSLRLVRTFPKAAAEIKPGIGRRLLARFPYGVIYGIDEDTILVIAVAHLHREPRYWADRNRIEPRSGARQLFAQSHPRQWVDRSNPAYKDGRTRTSLNPTHGSGWNVQV